MRKHRSTPDRPALGGVRVRDVPALGLHSDQAPPVAPLGVQDVAGDKSEEQVEDGDDCAELSGLVLGQACEIIPRIVDGKNDDIEEDTDNVDTETEEDWFLTLRNSHAPH
eukprot:GFUD01003447.1.p2 GENE.GFUD01003447.1~~GFUD01003447.1.p2  ORF type:complete len:110 (+),score=30.04 GFUD01003447.1:442-771(+)